MHPPREPEPVDLSHRARREGTLSRAPKLDPATRAFPPSLHRLQPRPWGLTAAVTTVAAAFTLLVVFLPPFDVAYRSPGMHIALETIGAVVGIIAAYLFVGRFRLDGRLSDLVLAIALLVLATGSLFFSALPAAIAGNDDAARYSAWAQVVSDLLGAIGFVIAAFTLRRVRLSKRSGGLVAGASVAGILLVAVVMRALATHLPAVIPPTLSPVSGGRMIVTGHPTALAAQSLSALLFALAAIGFLRRAPRSDDRLLPVLGAASAAAAFAAFNYFLFPSLYSQWVYSGDILLFAFYLLILAGIGRELNDHWTGLARAAVLEERRRIARDLHDGLAQELAFIASQTGLLGPGRLERQLASAAERALEESRRAIDALTKPLGEPVDVAVEKAAVEGVTATGTKLTLELQPGIATAPEVREALRRIVREATLNAARHGHAAHVRVSLEANGEGLRLRVDDDGDGFDPARQTDGFGLISIRERASGLGGRAAVRSAPGAGTTVEVVLP